MNEAKLRKLIEIFKESGVEELEYQESFWRGVRVRLGNNRQPSFAQPPMASPSQVAGVAAAEEGSVHLSTAEVAADGAPTDRAAASEAAIHTICAPMVGTVYMSPAPESEPFARTGDRVSVGQTLCIIEAMKIMNEIESDVDGELVEILAGNAEPVEYNQPIMKVRPT